MTEARDGNGRGTRAIAPEARRDLRRQVAAVRAALGAVAERLDRDDDDCGTVPDDLAALAGEMARLGELAGSAATAPHHGAPAVPGRGRVLLIDDEPLAVDCITEYLAGRGYDVLPAGTPRDALALAARRVIDVVVTDLRMPGMNGGQLVAELRKGRPGLPAVVVTGHLADRIDGSIGPVVVMRKPLALDQLEAAIADLLAAAAAEPAP